MKEKLNIFSNIFYIEIVTKYVKNTQLKCINIPLTVHN